MSKIDKRARFTFRLPNELLRKLKKEAEKQGSSVNALMLQILWEWKEEKIQK